MIEFSFVDCLKEWGWNCCCKYAEENKESQLHNRVIEGIAGRGSVGNFIAENTETEYTRDMNESTTKKRNQVKQITLSTLSYSPR
jgi:hypothetical protein